MTLYIASGASQNHFKSLKQFLSTVKQYRCFVYDLGLSQASVVELKTQYNIEYRLFDFTKYPEYYNISKNAGQYAWKPAIIKSIKDELSDKENAILLWCDAGNLLPSSLEQLIQHTLINKIYSPTSSGNIYRWTFPATLAWFSIQPGAPLLSSSCRNGAILAFRIDDKYVQEFIDTFDRCAGIEACIAPQGSNRGNHRQDQAVFTILYYQYFTTYPENKTHDGYFGIRIHQDCD